MDNDRLQFSRISLAVGIATAILGCASSPAIDMQRAALKPQPNISRTEQYLAQMTPVQRAHARYHSRVYRQFRGTASDVRSRPLDEPGLFHSVVTEPAVGDLPSKPVASVLTDMVCASDAVFRGTVASTQVFPTEDGSFLFTDYEVKVAEVFRQRHVSPAGAPLKADSTVTFTWLGGSVEIDGKATGAAISDFPALQQGDDYVILAIRLPETGAFTAPTGSRVFRLIKSSLTSIHPFPASDLKSDASLPLPLVFQLTQDANCR